MVHGPEIVDCGKAARLIDYLKRLGSVKAVLGGTMGRVAIMDADLESRISIQSKRRPSISIQDMAEGSDIIILLNQAKSRETGQAFGAMVAKAAGIEKPLIQIDYGGRFVSDLNPGAGLFDPDGKGDDSRAVAFRICTDLGLDLLEPPAVQSIYSQDGEVEVRRILTGVLPGELISVNGTVIARATNSQVEVIAREGKIVAVKGAEPKAHGLEKLPLVDLKDAIIRSGSIRRSLARARIGMNRGEGAVFIDHCAEDAFEISGGAALALTVGDDTTAIAGDVLARLGIPVVGIVDGDIDHLAQSLTIMPGSIFIRAMPGYDDIVGRRAKEEIFQGEARISITASDLAEKVEKLAGEHLRERIEVKEEIETEEEKEKQEIRYDLS